MAATFNEYAKPQAGRRGKDVACCSWRSLLADWRGMASSTSSNAQTLYAYLYELAPLERIYLAREGVPASAIARLAQAMDMPMARLLKALHLPASTMAGPIQSQQHLPVDQSERVMQAMRLIGLAERLAEEYGDPELHQGFNAAMWFGGWIQEPNPSLGMDKPSDFLDTATGAGLVESLLDKMVSGVCA